MATKTATAPTAKTRATTKASETDSRSTITNYLSSVVDSTKVLVDDVLDDVKSAEKGLRGRVNDIADKDLRKTLKKQTKTLQDQVDKLSRIRKGE